jgi:hypothetical protein
MVNLIASAIAGPGRRAYRVGVLRRLVEAASKLGAWVEGDLRVEHLAEERAAIVLMTRESVRTEGVLRALDHEEDRRAMRRGRQVSWLELVEIREEYEQRRQRLKARGRFVEHLKLPPIPCVDEETSEAMRRFADYDVDEVLDVDNSPLQ